MSSISQAKTRHSDYDTFNFIFLKNNDEVYSPARSSPRKQGEHIAERKGPAKTGLAEIVDKIRVYADKHAALDQQEIIVASGDHGT